MEKPTLRIGFIATGFGRGTGPSTYFRAVRKAMAGTHSICLMDGPCSQELDLVHVIDAKRAGMGLLDSISAPIIADFHDDYWIGPPGYPAPDGLLRRIRNRQLYSHHLAVIKRSSALVVHSRAVEASLVRLLDEELAGDAKRPEVFVVEYGIEATGHKPVHDNKSDEKIILLAGRDIFRKGFPVMIRALPLILDRHPSARLLVIGDEYVHTRLMAKIMARGLPVEFLSAQPPEALQEWYARSSVLALPSRREAFGIVLIEAMAAGLPVVAANTGGIPEAVEHGVSGLLHETGSQRDLADKVIAALGDLDLRERLVSGGLIRAKKFSIENMAEKLDAVYRAVAEAG
jgi:glycosyltransferase involved in cell wall biosynthesis